MELLTQNLVVIFKKRMDFCMNKFRRVAVVSCALVMWASLALGAVLDIRSGILFGASDVNVNGTLYDVDFLEGTCIGLYNGCDANSDFPFTNPADLSDTVLGLAAHAALLDQVFVDSALGNFDSVPSLTNGCSAVARCQFNTPFQILGGVGGNGLGLLTGFNDVFNAADISTGAGSGLRNFDTANPNLSPDLFVYAVWSDGGGSQTPPAVPEPSTILLFGSGLAGLIGWQYRKHQGK